MAELRFIQDFPIEGVKFIDISPKLADKDDFKNIINEMSKKSTRKHRLYTSARIKRVYFWSSNCTKFKFRICSSKKTWKITR